MADRSLRALVGAITARLEAAGVPTPQVDAQWLVANASGLTLTQMTLAGDDPLPPSAAEELERSVRRREAREPLQLVLGSVGFRRLDLEVRPGVFIPRPETEVLAGLAIDLAAPDAVVVEPCTGSGAVACAVASEASPGTVIATDFSAEAVALARDNAARLGLAVQVLQGDLLAGVPESLRGRVDVLVSNPPYVAEGELGELAPEVRDWDPVRALVSGVTGHECSDRLIALAARWLRPGGWLLLEVAAARAAECGHRARASGLEQVEVLADLTGRPRIVRARAYDASS